MTLDWQNLTVLVLVAAAVGYLARLAWQSVQRRRTGACGGCATCPSNAESQEPAVIGIDSLAKSAATNGKQTTMRG